MLFSALRKKIINKLQFSGMHQSLGKLENLLAGKYLKTKKKHKRKKSTKNV